MKGTTKSFGCSINGLWRRVGGYVDIPGIWWMCAGEKLPENMRPGGCDGVAENNDRVGRLREYAKIYVG